MVQDLKLVNFNHKFEEVVSARDTTHFISKEFFFKFEKCSSRLSFGKSLLFLYPDDPSSLSVLLFTLL